MPTPSATRAHFSPPPSSRGRRAEYDSDPDEETRNHRMDARVIDVDLAHPAKNHEVVIYSLVEFPYEESVYDAFYIFLPCDVRDAERGAFEATVHGDREILITMPALPYTFLRDTDELNEDLIASGDHVPKLQTAQDIAINAIMESDGAKVKRFLLRFPDGVNLSNIFAGGALKLETEYEAYPTNTTIRGHPTIIFPCMEFWRVADLSTARREKLRQAKKDVAKEKMDKLAARLKRLSTGAGVVGMQE